MNLGEKAGEYVLSGEEYAELMLARLELKMLKDYMRDKRSVYAGISREEVECICNLMCNEECS